MLPTTGVALTSSQLLAVHEFAQRVVEANVAHGGVDIRRAWERVISVADAAEEKQKRRQEKENEKVAKNAGAPEADDEEEATSFVSLGAGRGLYDNASCLELAPFVFPPPESAKKAAAPTPTTADGAALGEKIGVPPELIFAYSTHRLLSEDGFYFKLLHRGAFAPRRELELTVGRATKGGFLGGRGKRSCRRVICFFGS